MPDDHSKLVPLLPIPNRTVKRLSADDSADSRVKVGHRQALIVTIAQLINRSSGRFVLCVLVSVSHWPLCHEVVRAGVKFSSCVLLWSASS